MKHLSTKLLILFLLIMAALSGYNYFQTPFLKRFQQVEEIVEDSTEPEKDLAAIALDSLSTKEKVEQLISLPVVLGDEEASTAAQLAWLTKHQPGFIALFGDNITLTEASSFTDQLDALDLDYAPLVAVDHEGGSVQRLAGAGFTRLPSWRQSCELTAKERTTLYLESALELNQAGVQLVFAPVVDVARSGSFLGSRACETEVVSTASDFITSMAQYGVLSVVKHFPGIGSLTSDPHFQLDTVELETKDTIVFDQLLDTFPNIGVMTTHVVVAGRTNGIPCSLSTVCLASFITNFPEAILFTDALEMTAAGLEEGLTEPKELTTVAVQALAAGNDVLVFGEKVDLKTIDSVLIALANKYELDDNFQRQVDMSVKKVLSVKMPAVEEAQ